MSRALTDAQAKARSRAVRKLEWAGMRYQRPEPTFVGEQLHRAVCESA